MKDAIVLVVIIGSIHVSPLPHAQTHAVGLQSGRSNQTGVRATPREVPDREQTSLPEWLTQLIRKLESAPPANPPARLTRYTYRDQTVFYLPPRCCDIASILYDADGKVLCKPDGGLTGAGDGRCSDFSKERKDERLIWQDTRRRGR